MPAQFLLNITIAFLWTLLMDEDAFYPTTFLTGYLIGIGILFLMHRFFGTKFYLLRVFSALKLLLIFISELSQSSLLIMKQILSPKLNIKPGIFTYEHSMEGDYELTTLALLLTLTPGSVVMEVSPDGKVFYIHAMDVESSRDSVLKSIKVFEKAIMEVTRN
ncbi:Na+/H+ antiporter subunit E [Microbacterium sp. APC 3898]|uniref:Na+/H+ antiporter subunit E n=2 Tax=Planococcus TaxID=1372 RepID=A0ABT7ZK54_9BACL|nr:MULTISPECIES: Na+/H+ antiporter subunit E [Terrabacteria group]MBF6632720.1 Na+/H+ antiporter subunit E [Planococcus sp. (in: firmicutes)]MBD8014674.1 Na+/H+ antiporter subunit E [Planococcus wigleyi]MDN3427545.1 Na+/H+ antiporter subunit E [Planococcus sp. APC 4016]MDN3436900.1 Na+/H+ antiporter subunit E [Planococcus sp. APC 3900]MDN3499096.1 Na+/H+ antiporter subunit E [Microbacterium sp. APC 3898]